MTTNHSEEIQRPRSAQAQSRQTGWTRTHSWAFLVIVGIGLAIIAMENRYHYLSPLGLGKAYRIDKLFGSIQEFDPVDGWIIAKLTGGPPPQMQGMAPAPSVGAPPVPMNIPAAGPPETPTPSSAVTGEEPRTPAVQPAERRVAGVEKPADETPGEGPAEAEKTPVVQPEEKPTGRRAAAQPQLSREECFKLFMKQYPDFTKEEFQLAYEDLFPDWKKKTPNATWQDFMNVYGDFIEWWNDAGQPQKSGIDLWKEFLTSRKR